MEQVFANATVDAPVEGVAVQDTEKKEKVKAMKEALRETVSTDGSFSEKLRRLSNSVIVTHTLGYGKGGNIVVDKNASSSDKRALKPTSAICGYEIQNIGDEAIEYMTEEFAQDETGKFVGTVLKKTLAPGEKANLTRQYMTMFCAQPEISFTLANGKIVSSSKKNAKNLKEELAAYYFSFNKDENGTAPQVNDDEVKLSVDDENGKVKPEYVATFGYLNNPKEGKAGRGTKGGAKFTTQDLAANYIHKMLQNEGIM
jgi:hypothetical protein